MKKHLIVIGTAVLLLVVGLSGCNELNPLSSEVDRFVVTWKDEHCAIITFFPDGEWVGSGVWISPIGEMTGNG